MHAGDQIYEFLKVLWKQILKTLSRKEVATFIGEKTTKDQ